MNQCSNVPPNVLSQKERIVVIGDFHADWEKTKKIFVKLKLIDNNSKWIALTTGLESNSKSSISSRTVS